MFSRTGRKWVGVAWGLVVLALAACASATPEATLTPIPTATIAVTATRPPTAAASPTDAATATLAASATPAASSTGAASATSATTATAVASATAAASATVAASATAAAPTARPTAADFTPQQTSVWDTELSPNTDNMQGTCSNPVNPVYGLVQVTPQGNTLVWKNQEPAPYTMTRVRASVWQYSGPTSVNDGTVTMVVQFTSATTLKLTRTFVSAAEPNCTHVHTYNGVFQWNR